MGWADSFPRETGVPGRGRKGADIHLKSWPDEALKRGLFLFLGDVFRVAFSKALDNALRRFFSSLEDLSQSFFEQFLGLVELLVFSVLHDFREPQNEERPPPINLSGNKHRAWHKIYCILLSPRS